MYSWLLGFMAPFILVVLPLVLSPGPDTLLIVRNTLSSGRRVGMAAVLGVQLGLTVHMLLALVGISLFILQFPQLYSTLVLVGAAYLAWLGVLSFRQRGVMTLHKSKRVGARASMVSAMLCNLLNPKVLMLFFTLLPGFVGLDLTLSVELQLALLVLCLIVINSIWQGLLVVFCHQLSRWLLSPRVTRMLGRLCGCVFLFFALAMLYEHSW